MKKLGFIAILLLLLGFTGPANAANSTIFGTGNTTTTIAYFCLNGGCTDATGKPVTLVIYNDAQPNDLSSTFANVSGTIYNKNTDVGYATPKDFFAASGVTTFTGITFDTSWTPGTPNQSSTPTINTTPSPLPPPTPAPAPAPTQAPAVVYPVQLQFLEYPGYSYNGPHNVSLGTPNQDILNHINDAPGYFNAVTVTNTVLTITMAPFEIQNVDGTTSVLPEYAGMNGDQIFGSIRSSTPADAITYQDNTFSRYHTIPDQILGIKPYTIYLLKVVATEGSGNSTAVVNFSETLSWH